MTDEDQNNIALTDTDLMDLTADVVSAYVGNNTVAASDLAALISDVHGALQDTATVRDPEPEPLTPAVPIKKSVTPDFIICLEDGKRFKSLKRHLRTHFDMTPEDYRAKWGLDADYPMVAPNYAAARSELAKKMGLGQQRKTKKLSRGKAKGK
jgi:MucR family transcriptional regulator, transcriptional regulator of exopolysaccharide biosynthesis